MPNGYGDINSPYNIRPSLGGINKPYGTLLDDLNVPPVPREISIEAGMDEGYEPQEEQQATEGGGMFSDILGPGADIYDPQSIADALMKKYAVSGLTAGMFPSMSKDLMAASQASTYDAYKSMLGDPVRQEFRKDVSESAGILNPNKRRQRALRTYKAGMSDISSNIFAKTTMARTGIREWLSNALAKVRRMKY